MSRSALLTITLVVVPSLACSINGKAIGPHLGGATASAPPSSPSSEAAAPPSSPVASAAPAEPAAEPDPNMIQAEFPDLSGMTLADARIAAARAGFRQVLDETSFANGDSNLDWRVPNAACHDGRVCAQSPAPHARAYEATPLTVSIEGDSDDDLQVPPETIGMLKDDAISVMREHGFADVTFVAGACETGRVCSLDPPAGKMVKPHTHLTARIGK